MSNYLNQIESDLYKLYSITNGSGEVVEMVAELKEKYEKAKAYDGVAEKLYARINHIVRTSHPTQHNPGYIDGLYNALDIISSELEGGESE